VTAGNSIIHYAPLPKTHTALEEIERLNKQLAQAAALFPAILALCEYAADQREAQRWQ
jgi:hypothetical protein